jgi:hypothetical protein
MAATYVYAIIPTGDEVTFDVAGVDDHDYHVYSIPYPYRDIAAVVSASPLTDYRGLKRDQAVRYLVAHQRVVEAVMREFPILPVKFGTVLSDKAWVQRLLNQGGALFRTALERFTDLVQMEVVVLWNLQEVFQEIGQEEPIARLKAQVATRAPEETMSERVAIGQMVQASLQRRRAALQDHLLPSLREVALDLVVNALMDDSMVLNVALLVDRAGQEALDRRLQALDEEFGGRFRFRRVGPLPPYSFSTVEVQVPSFEAVDEARRRLGLGETVSLDKIRRAYHRLAGQMHPDHNPDDPEAEARIAELTRAYEFLTTYAETVQRSGGAGESTPAPLLPCIFSREEVERMLLIAIRRQEMVA